MSDEHWSETFVHDSVTTDNRADFVSANSKYATMEDAAFGGFNAQKRAGKPFWFPESIDKLPDDASRSDFTTKARSLLGINIPKDVEALNDFNFKDGLAEGSKVDDNFVGLIKNWAVEKGVSTSELKKMVSFYNGPLTKHVTEIAAEMETQQFEAAAKACHEALVADPDFGSDEKVKEQSELFRRAILNKFGLSPDDAEEVADAMVKGGLTTNPKLAKIMLKAFAPMAAEGSTNAGGGTGTAGIKQASPYEAKKTRWPKSPTEWGNESDKWEDESPQTRNALGYKDPNAQ